MTSIVDAPEYLFTSESVTEGHPDKLCDQVSDAILDAMLEQDPGARVAVETMVTTGLVHVAGEVKELGHILLHKAEVVIPKVVLEILDAAGNDIVKNDDVMTRGQQFIGQV